MNLRFNYILLLIFAFHSACDQSGKTSEPQNEDTPAVTPIEQVEPTFTALLDSAGLTGSILIFDPNTNTFHSNDFNWAKVGRLPASTFKIPNSIIALETGVVADSNTLFKWDGKKRRLSTWEKDLTFHEAYHASCVPCYQEIARKIGAERMQTYLRNFSYGHMIVDSASIDLFWLEGDSRISQFEEIDFIRRFHQQELPISGRTYNIMKDLMILDRHADYTISGKTGWTMRNGYNNGWFVGYIESRDEKLYYFATNVDPQEDLDMKKFPSARKEVTIQAFQLLGIIP